MGLRPRKWQLRDLERHQCSITLNNQWKLSLSQSLEERLSQGENAATVHSK